MTSSLVRKGTVFTHLSFLDPDWTPGPGQRVVDGPRARMVITRATVQTVWYGYVGDSKGGWRMDRVEFERLYVSSGLLEAPVGE